MVKQPALFLTALLVLLLALVSPMGSHTDSSLRVEVLPIDPDPRYADAFEPESLGFACAEEVQTLQAFFLEQKLPFSSSLVRETSEVFCHVYYEPSLRGFRADPDNQPIRGIVFDLSGPNLLAHRESTFGDGLDAVKTILAKVPRSLDVSLGLPLIHDRTWYEQSKEWHFGGLPHRIELRDNQLEDYSGWPQDYLKSGKVGSVQRILISRRVYGNDDGEGDSQARSYQPYLNNLNSEALVRSNLSWEGGDLQFVRDPRQPEELILFLGRNSRKYWGGSLSLQEYAYILKLEFGADRLVEFGDLVSHVDYFVSFLPDSNIALVSEPLVGHKDIAKAALDLLVRHFPKNEIPPALEASRLLSLSAKEFSTERKAIRRRFEEFRESWLEDPKEGELGKEFDRYVSTFCAGDQQECFSAAGQAWLLEHEPALLSRLISAEILHYSQQLERPRLLAIIESQSEGFKPRLAGKVKPKVRQLEKLGFRVVRVPRISGDPNLDPPWPGVSYVNALLVDRMLFVPRFGPGPAEDGILAELQAAIPEYEVVPVHARHLLLRNGGLHCISGIIRF